MGDSKTSAAIEACRGNLRQRTRQAMRDEVSAVAYELFLSQGFDQTTIDQVVERAGISRSSFFRYFPTKEDVVVSSLSDYGEVLKAALEERPQDEPVWLALRNAMNSLVTAAELDEERTRASVRMQESAPSVKARHYEKTLVWQAMLIPEVARRAGWPHSEESGDPRAEAVVVSAIACLEAATRAWAFGVPGRGLGEVLDAAMGALEQQLVGQQR